MGLTQEEVKALLGEKKDTRRATEIIGSGYPHKNSRNTKHVTWVDDETRCTSRRCGSPTYIKILGMPLCSTHAILKLSEILDPKPKLEGEL
jgi:hypothetical protein